MKVYLLRHGRPEREVRDPARPLSPQGRGEVARLAAFLADREVQVSAVHHSDKLRARQTAEMVSEVLTPAEGCRHSRGLRPLDDPGEWRGRLERGGEDLMLVGHLPHLDLLASSLLADRAFGGFFDFPAAGAACLERAGAGRWVLGWFLGPGMLPSLPEDSRE